MEIISHSVVSRKTYGKLNYNAWGSVITLNSGTLLCVWSGDRHKHVCPFGKVLASRSIDGGRTWSPPYIAFESPLDDRDAGLCQTADGTVFLTSFTNSRKTQRKYAKDRKYTEAECAFHEGYLAMLSDEEEQRWLGTVITKSEDGGRTFSNPVILPITAPHGPLALPNGSLLFIGTAFSDAAKASFPYLDDGIYAVEISKDLKASKPWLVIPADSRPDTFHCEPHSCMLPSGKIILGVRVQNYKTGLFTIYQCSSRDSGKTFSPLRETGFDGAPPHYFVHSSGALILTYGRRNKPYAEVARVSYDEGESWSEEFILCDYAPDDDLGYTCTTENARGELVTIYYQRKNESESGCSILSTTWKL